VAHNVIPGLVDSPKTGYIVDVDGWVTCIVVAKVEDNDDNNTTAITATSALQQQ